MIGLNNFIPFPEVDTVAVFDSNYNQVFENARPIKTNSRVALKPMEHPIESGQMITDYKIVLPAEIILPIVVTAEYYLDTYREIYTLFTTSEALTVQSRVGIYPNMFITEMPDDERPEMFDAVTIELKLKQVMVVQASSSFAPADPVQADTQNSGQQSGTETTSVTTDSGITASGLVSAPVPQNPQYVRSSVYSGGRLF